MKKIMVMSAALLMVLAGCAYAASSGGCGFWAKLLGQCSAQQPTDAQKGMGCGFWDRMTGNCGLSPGVTAKVCPGGQVQDTKSGQCIPRFKAWVKRFYDPLDPPAFGERSASDTACAAAAGSITNSVEQAFQSAATSGHTIWDSGYNGLYVVDKQGNYVAQKTDGAWILYNPAKSPSANWAGAPGKSVGPALASNCGGDSPCYAVSIGTVWTTTCYSGTLETSNAGGNSVKCIVFNGATGQCVTTDNTLNGCISASAWEPQDGMYCNSVPPLKLSGCPNPAGDGIFGCEGWPNYQNRCRTCFNA